MPKFKEEKVLNYTARQLYDLVLDVERYPSFVPWCSACKIISTNDSEIIADLTVKFGFFEKSYRSRIKHGVDREEYFIEVTKISGSFKKLDTNWRFEKHSKTSTLLKFEIDFAFETELINDLIGGMFEQATKKMVEAFENRAEVIYGRCQ